MKTVLFLSRVAFLCNIFFILAVTLQLGNWIRNEDVTATIAIIGFFLSAIFNPLVNFLYLVLFLIRKKFWVLVPAWLFTANILFLVMQIFYILYLNDTKHN